jgi:hypothetical protein
MPGCDSSLYQFASWGGRVFSDEHRERCCDAIQEHLGWVLAHRRQIASGEYPEHNLGEFAELVSLEQFIVSAHLRP